MNLQYILAAFRAWEEARLEATSLHQLFASGTHFMLDLSALPELDPDAFIHAYPAVVDGDLHLLFIHANKDHPDALGSLGDAVQLVPFAAVGSDEIIPDEEAHNRINEWQTTKTTWLNDNMLHPNGEFACFLIPAKFLTAPEYHVFLALKPDPDPEGSLLWDLVLWDGVSPEVAYPQKGAIAFHDAVRLCPPFHVNEAPETDKANFALFTAFEQ